MLYPIVMNSMSSRELFGIESCLGGMMTLGKGVELDAGRWCRMKKKKRRAGCKKTAREGEVSSVFLNSP